MLCLRSRDSDFMERYMHGRLSETEQAAFDEHLVECAECVEELTRLGAMRAELEHRRAAIEAAAAPPERPPWVTLLAVAAVLLVAIGLTLLWQPRSADGIAELASFEPPEYQPPRLRAFVDEAEEEFRAAMDRYQDGDFEGAIGGLETAAELDPDRVDAPFFLGASLLLTGDTEAALGHLTRVVETGDLQYLQEALYLRAQAYLLLGDAESAGSDLQAIIELGGGWEERARNQLDELTARSATGVSGPSSPPAASTPALAEARALIDAGRYTEAESAAEGLIERYRAERGSRLPEARALDLWVEARWRNGKAWHMGTLEAAERAAELKAVELGADSAEVATSVFHQARVLDESGRFDEALDRYEQAIDHYLETVGASDPRTALATVYLGGMLVELGQLRAARPHLEEGLEAFESQLGPDHPHVAEALVHLGWLEVYARNLEVGRGHFERALSILEARLGPEHPALGDPLDGLTWGLRDLNDFEGSRRAGRRAMRLRTLALGPEHPWLAFNYHLLWRVADNDSRGDAFLKSAAAIAESSYPANHPMVGLILGYSAFAADSGDDWMLFERGLKILEGSYGSDHWRVGLLLANLSLRIWELGDLERARELLDRVVAILEGSEVRGSYGALLEDRIRLYEEMGLVDLEEAIVAGERALAVAREERSFFVASVLEGQARRLMMSGRLPEANAMAEEALKAREAYASPDHLHLGDTLWNLAEIRAGLGDFESALELNRRALSINETWDDRFAMQRNLHLETRLLWAMGRLEGAADTAMRLEAGRRGLNRHALPGLPERQSLTLTDRQLTGRDFLLSAAIADPGSGHEQTATDAVIRSRGIVLDLLAQRNSVTKFQRDAETMRLDRAVTRARENLARLVVGVGGEGDAEDRGARIRRASREKEQAELALAAHSRRFRRQREARSAGLAETRAALPERSGVVSYVRFDLYGFAGRDRSTGWPLESTPGYLAIVLRADREEPALVNLGAAPAIDRLVDALREQIWRLAAAVDRAPELSLSQYGRMGSALREAIWEPVAPALKGLEQVFIVPDGELHLVDWGALPARSGGYLIEQPLRLHYLSAERDLVARPARSGSAGRLLAMGDPAFDETDLYAALAAEDSEVLQMARLDLEAEGPVFRGRCPSCDGFANLRFEELPAAAEELRSIEASWSGSGTAGVPVVLSRAAANEAAFKARAPGNQVIHLATHGFYLGGACEAAADGRRGGPAIDNPLLFSGLALAGANHRQAAGPKEEDGVLTAEEIAALDLQAVDWAVLSGCETGVGETRAGEGVFGLRRAFQIAGARTVIMSLWPVDDEVTRDWMEALYRYRFAEELSTIEAVRRAHVELLAARRAAGLSTHPFYWAGFVAAGDWR